MILAHTMDVPLKTDTDGTIRVGQTRVRIDTVIYAFNEGYTAEEIVSQYPTLNLSEVYAVLAYYLNDRTTIDKYLAERAYMAKAIQQDIESRTEYREFREQLLKRRSAL